MVEQGSLIRLPALVSAVVHRGLSSKGLTDCGLDGRANVLSFEPGRNGITCPACLKVQLERSWASPAADAHYTHAQLDALALWYELGGWPYDRASAGGEAAGRLWGWEHRGAGEMETAHAAGEAYSRIFGRGEGRWSGNEAHDQELFVRAFAHGTTYWAGDV